MQVWAIERDANDPATQWDAAKAQQLVGLNEYLERMLVALDGFTGLQVDSLAHKKVRVAQINELLSRIDDLRRAGLAPYPEQA